MKFKIAKKFFLKNRPILKRTVPGCEQCIIDQSGALFRSFVLKKTLIFANGSFIKVKKRQKQLKIANREKPLPNKDKQPLKKLKNCKLEKRLKIDTIKNGKNYKSEKRPKFKSFKNR